MSDDVLVRVDNVSKRFCRSLKRSLWYGLQDLGSEIGGRRHGGGSGLPQSSADVQLRPDEFWAVKDVSFELRRGECLGLIGRNGAGKTTLLKMLNGLIKPDTGCVEMRGRTGALIALGAGFNPILSGRENIFISGSVLGLSKKEIDEKVDEIVDFAEIPDFIDSPVQTYSSGMQVRLGFAIATALNPDILILDEVLAVGDGNFKSKCMNRIGKTLATSAVIFVSHSMHQVYRICTQAALLGKGSLLQIGNPSIIVKEYERQSHLPFASKGLFVDKAFADHCTVDVHCKEIDAGESIEVQIRFYAVASFKVGLYIFNLTNSSGVLCAEQRLRLQADTNLCEEGDNVLRFKTNPISLRSGLYQMSLAVYDEKGLVNIIHGDSFGSVYINNSVGTEALMTI